jgi:hypothetical protein
MPLSSLVDSLERFPDQVHSYESMRRPSLQSYVGKVAHPGIRSDLALEIAGVAGPVSQIKSYLWGRAP